ncbi:MAG TPA: dienelactone hydrolase family protein [Longimicrobiales bacterium]|nr:dienelactone hydrolase family protein [Longimicrobiales bacterium]
MRPHLLLALLVLAACGPADDAPAAEDSSAPADAGPRVPRAPTAPGALPPAILGQGGELQGTSVRYLPDDPTTVGYLAVPEGDGPFPALVIVHEWNGLVDRVRQVADDLAAEGYVTLAVDLFSGRVGTNPQENMALVREVQADMPKVIANLNGAVAYLKARPDVSGRVGAMGWCFGGGIALSFGLDGVDHDATAIFYGQLVDDPARLAALDHEVYGTFARLDTGPSPEQVAAFEAALREAGIENDLHIYDAVNHGFWLRIDEDPGVRTAPALDAWERLESYLERTLGG